MKHNKSISLFSVSFRQGFTSPNLPIASFNQGDKEINFLLDSGSDRNVIDGNALKQFEHTPHGEDAEKINLSGVGGSQKTSSCTLTFNCDTEQYTVDFLVTDISEAFEGIKREHGLTVHGILGSRFLAENNIVLDFNTLEAYTKK